MDSAGNCCGFGVGVVHLFEDAMKRAEQIQLARNVAYSWKQLATGINGYVYNNDSTAFLSIAVVLRKLLLDKGSANSFQQKSDSIVELFLVDGEKIFLRGFEVSKRRKSVAQTPPLYHHKSDIIYDAVYRGKLMPLNRWLDGAIVHAQQGDVLTTSEIIKSVADKQGAHIIKRKPKIDAFGGASLALISPDVPASEIDTVDFEVPWQHFIIASAVKLLHAVKSPEKTPLIPDHGVRVPDAMIGEASTLWRRRSSLRSGQRG